MKIRRLSLHAWRGVSARDIALGDGVTLIEGANEIGKSTLVEALRMLFREQDSSKKKDVKAIQPVGEDVGSSVEAEIECGDLHFTYRKTYNRRPGTELHIHAPRTEHLTGGDAHNRARAILDAHMDVGLWDTLLVEQGHALGAINLADSNGLARALDVASGGQGSDGDGSQLLEAARAEYERYYTLKAGKEKFSEQIEAVDKLTLEVTDLEQALQALDEDLRRAEKLEEDLQRLQQRLPELQANARELAERWSAIARLKDDIAQMQAARTPLAALRDSARENNHSRQQKVQNSQHIDAQIIELSHRIEPEAAALQTSQSVLDDMLAELSRLRQQRRQQQERERQAQADLRYLADNDMLREIEQRLQRLSAYNEQSTALRLQLDAISINAQGRRDIEAAHSELALARALQESSATRMELACDRELSLTIDGASQTLGAGQSLQRYLTQPLCLELPGGVVIRLAPAAARKTPKPASRRRNQRCGRCWPSIMSLISPTRLPATNGDRHYRVTWHRFRPALAISSRRNSTLRKTWRRGLGSYEPLRRTTSINTAETIYPLTRSQQSAYGRMPSRISGRQIRKLMHSRVRWHGNARRTRRRPRRIASWPRSSWLSARNSHSSRRA